MASDEFEIFDDEFQSMPGSSPTLVQRAEGMAFAEGVCWVPRLNKVIVSDIPNNRIVSWGESEGFGIYR